MEGRRDSMFNLKPGDKITYWDVDKDSYKARARFKVVKIYPHIFMARKMHGNNREIGISKRDYLCGAAKLIER